MSVASDAVAVRRGPLVVVGGVLAAIVVASAADAVLALLALAGVPSEHLTAALRLSDEFLKNPQSIEGLSWLQMGLAARGRKVEDCESRFRPRNVRDISLRLLALAALEGRTL